MASLRSALQIGILCLTAVTTLVNSVPHFDCVCPNGTHKTFCLGGSVTRDGCCCGSGCCPSAGAETSSQKSKQPVEKGCPSCRHGQQSERASGTRSQLGGSCCHMTPAQADPATVISTPATPHQYLTGEFSCPLTRFASRELTAVRIPFSWYSYHLPPPLDTIVTLQHFTI